ncbi:MAG: 2-hydroxyglutaryl-CoA dehydratase [Thermoanaerobacteraceae bacterium]|nr:2-hydroxyglutaryl-CoA dehydratase [Thermoanaerobacteraceae bacterium]
MSRTIGIPATLTYYSYFPFWQTFFTRLGYKVIASPLSSKQIVDWGVKETVNDACIPIKLFHGHVVALRDKVDYLFIPRMVSVDGKATFCPKFLGLPDMIRASIAGLPRLIDERIELKNGARGLLKTCYKIGSNLKETPAKILRAYWAACKAHWQYQKLLIQGVLPGEILHQQEIVAVHDRRSAVNLAVLGYPYEVHDPFISVNLLQHLAAMNVKVWTVEMVPTHVLAKFRHCLPKNLFWHYSNRVVWACYYYLRQPIDGIIHVSAFGCGPDAMVDKLIELEAKKHNMPFMTLTIDEHTGEAGAVTRLEAFIDMVMFRRENR